MLPTPNTSHLSFTHIYEPSEDSHLLLDTLSHPSETAFLRTQFPRATTPTPLLLEVGSGSGIVLSFLTTHATTILGRNDLLTLSTDVSSYACAATIQTIQHNSPGGADRGGLFCGALNADLFTPLRPHTTDILLFNPPYVPTPDPPPKPTIDTFADPAVSAFDMESRYLELTYAGGPTGMVTTDRFLDGLEGVLSPRGVLYLLLCAQNKPEEVAERLRAGGYGKKGVRWQVEKVGSSGRKGGWEVLSVWRVWR